MYVSWVGVIVDFLLLSFKLSFGCLFSPHHVNQGATVSRRRPRKSLFTCPPLLNILSGDANNCFPRAWNYKTSELTFRRQKKTRYSDPRVEWPTMGFVRESGLILWVWGARSESNPYLTCMQYICQVPNLINYQLQTLRYQQLVDKNWSYQQVVHNQKLLDSLSIRILLIVKNSLLIAHQ